ncbi:MAG: protein-L-isoaspartate O-methyltransferase-domain-containing protein [Monoraphidium minutum]|nr:MAG: protein-L-isoaspartate O-methyltransferase-domain-containing protein [Monoraphidium minutum]
MEHEPAREPDHDEEAAEESGEEGEEEPTNADLVAALRGSGMLTSEAVARAMLAVPRGSFVPAEYRDEAYIDAPIRVEAEDFNISAPHMHASMLEALRLKPGDKFLDVGCGCGILAACAAMLVGPGGRVAGVDVRSYCVELSADNVDALRRSSADYAAAACEIEFERHNVFLPSRRYRGHFNKVCIGAACPEERVHLLLQLLPQEPGSLLLAPVENDLRLYERRRDGGARATNVSSVRFSELEVPSDATVALAVLEDAAAGRLAVAVSGSTWATDMAGLVAGGGEGRADGAAPAPAGDSGDDSSCHGCALNNQADRRASASGGATGSASPRGSDGSARGGGGREGGAGAGGAAAPPPPPPPPPPRDFDAAFAAVSGVLGPGDYELRGAGWRVAAHRDVLRARCPHFRARLSSGMRDSGDGSHAVPEGFAQHSVQALVGYLYTDALPPGLEPPQLAELLHAGSFYGCGRLIELCEQALVDALLQLDPDEAAAEAPSLLRLGSELGLSQLQTAAAAFIAGHYAAAARSEAYAALSRAEVDRVASELAASVDKMHAVLKELQPPEGTPAMTAAQRQRILWW